MEYFSGTVTHVIFSNPVNGYLVLKMRLDSNSTIQKITDCNDVFENSSDFSEFEEDTSVKGIVSGLEVGIGSWFGFEGRWVTDVKYGRQVEIKRAPILKGEWTPEIAVVMLPSPLISGTVARLLHRHFGDDLLNALEDAEMIKSVPGINQRLGAIVVERWQAVVAVYKSLDFLHSLDIPKSLINNIWTTFGDEAQEVLTKNPWRLVKVEGLNFGHADMVANTLKLDMSSSFRSQGAVLQAAKNLRETGSLYMTTGFLKYQVNFMAPDITLPQMAEGVQLCVQDNELISDKEFTSAAAIYEPWFYKLEQESSALLAQRLHTANISEHHIKKVVLSSSRAMASFKKDPDNVREVFREAIHEWEGQSRITLAEEQFEGILNALIDPVSVLTGLPGTGKTTSVQGFVHILQEACIPFLLLSPTGIAAKRLSSVTGSQAYTVHKAFEACIQNSEDGREASYVGLIGRKNTTLGDGSDQSWSYGPSHPYPVDVVLVDESSMLDQNLLFRILTCTSVKCRVVFVGDTAQLPSVGPGSVLKGIIDSGFVPVTSLTRIYRQQEASKIIKAAHAINRGEVPEFVFTNDTPDFKYIQIDDSGEIVKTIEKIVDTLYSNRKKFQVLSPRHGSDLGVTNLNKVLRTLLNSASPGKIEARVGNKTLRENDRIMVTKNRYDLGICNGDTGKIKKVDLKNRKLLLTIHGNPDMEVILPFSEILKTIRLAYCVTVHKMQGLESDIIVMPFVKAFGLQLQRNLLYTAITRARKSVIMVGHSVAFRRAVMNDKIDQRNTLLQERIVNFYGDEEYRNKILEPLEQEVLGVKSLKGDASLDASLDYLKKKIDKTNTQQRSRQDEIEARHFDEFWHHER